MVILGPGILINPSAPESFQKGCPKSRHFFVCVCVYFSLSVETPKRIASKKAPARSVGFGIVKKRAPPRRFAARSPRSARRRRSFPRSRAFGAPAAGRRRHRWSGGNFPRISSPLFAIFFGLCWGSPLFSTNQANIYIYIYIYICWGPNSSQGKRREEETSRWGCPNGQRPCRSTALGPV